MHILDAQLDTGFRLAQSSGNVLVCLWSLRLGHQSKYLNVLWHTITWSLLILNVVCQCSNWCVRSMISSGKFTLQLELSRGFVVEVDMFAGDWGLEQSWDGLLCVHRNYMNDSFRTNVFVRYYPETIACACIYLAARRLSVRLLCIVQSTHTHDIIINRVSSSQNISLNSNKITCCQSKVFGLSYRQLLLTLMWSHVIDSYCWHWCGHMLSTATVDTDVVTCYRQLLLTLMWSHVIDSCC